MSDIIIPSNPTDRAALKAGLEEITHAMTMIDAQKDHKKEIVDHLKETFGLSPAVINKMAKTMHDRTYESQQKANEDFELLYETIVEGYSGEEDSSSEED